MKNCPNCNSIVSNTFHFCPKCGQETILDQNVGSLFTHFLNDYFTFDSKIIRSVAPLITRPAFLTKEFLLGRRVQYIAPLRLFIFLSLIFFLVLSLTNSSKIPIDKINDVNEAIMNRFFENWLPKLFFLLLPLFAFLITFLYRKKKMGLLPHFLFAVHFHSSLFLLGIIYAIISYFFSKLGWVFVNQLLLGMIGMYLSFYLWQSLRKMYDESKLITSLKFGLLAISYTILLVVSTIILYIALQL